MGLKCSLLGHDYGDVEVERSREEQGNEVVETVREVKHCERCGAESVVSENTEVRTAVDAETVGLDADTEDTGTADADDGADGSAGERDLVSAVSHVGDETGGEGDESEPEPTTEQSTQHESRFDDVTAGDAADHPRVGDDDGFEAATDATEDDAIILDEEGEEPDAPDRQPGQWPAADDTRQEERDTEVLQTGAEGGLESTSDTEDTPDEADADDGEDADDTEDTAPSWPTPEGDDEGFAAEPGGSTSDAEVSAGQPSPSEADEPTVEDGFDAEFIDDTGTTDEAESTAEEGLTCPACGFDAGPSPSLRQGDICPECHRGYLHDPTSE
ncbi:DUF7093 family protein [Halospeciosus flavus]|uniref:Oxidoreductase n=1 Tax=Halospeciosus flavus TaxID=3032283 RepID=A0ABD5Z5W4_9EURY|nr:hypothetical protein [Halospeciosus flavus]